MPRMPLVLPGWAGPTGLCLMAFAAAHARQLRHAAVIFQHAVEGRKYFGLESQQRNLNLRQALRSPVQDPPLLAVPSFQKRTVRRQRSRDCFTDGRRPRRKFPQSMSPLLEGERRRNPQ